MCFVDEDRIHLVHDGVIMRTLNHLRALILHIIPQIIEAEFVIGRIGDVAGIGRLTLIIIQTMLDNANGQTEEVI